MINGRARIGHAMDKHGTRAKVKLKSNTSEQPDWALTYGESIMEMLAI